MKICNDPRILDWVKGYSIPFVSHPPTHDIPSTLRSDTESFIIQMEIRKMIQIGAISQCEYTDGQFISPIFVIPKPNGTYRFILNLKNLNNYVDTQHFKLEDIRTACKLMSPHCYMAKIDLRDAYFSLPLHPDSKKFLRFKFQDKLYEFNCIPFGLCTAPFLFTKLMKPVCTYLRTRNIILTSYLDDIIFFNSSKHQCSKNVELACKLLQDLGFVVNYEKSSLIPATSCTYLGLTLDSDSMTLSVPQKKQAAIQEIISKFKTKKQCKIREFSHVLGKLNSICPAVSYGWVYTKKLERARYLALLNSNEDYDACMQISSNLIPELDWWKVNIINCNPIKQHQFALEIHTDASTTGWGAACGSERASGSWSLTEKLNHINYLEIKAAFLGLKCFTGNINNCEILLRVDNTTAVAYINKMGGVQFPHLNKITRELWQYCERQNIWTYASYINTKENTEADLESRRVNIEWELSMTAFDNIVHQFGRPEIDLFASRINNKCKQFVSWKRDPEAVAVDAFTLNWNKYFFYAFPPFSLILKCIRKIQADKAVGILVFPYWPSQAWFPVLKSLLSSDLLYFGPDEQLLTSPFRQAHPLHQQLTLAAGLLSAKHL